MATTAYKVGVPDSAAGAGVREMLALDSQLAALHQVGAIVEAGDRWHVQATAAAVTPPLVSNSLPPYPFIAQQVPSGKALLFQGGHLHSLTAATEYARVCRRYMMFGEQADAAPSAPAAPTATPTAATDGIATGGSYLYKLAPIDIMGQEGPLGSASGSATLTTTNRIIVLTSLPALSGGTVGYRIYRSNDAGANYYFCGQTFGAQNYVDAATDAEVATMGNRTPNNNWTTGVIHHGGVGGTAETADGPCELIIEIGPATNTGNPATLIYKSVHDITHYASVTWPTTAFTRQRVLFVGESVNMVAIGVAANRGNVLRGPYTSDPRTRLPFNHGATRVTGRGVAITVGAYVIWGQQVIGESEANVNTINSLRINPINPNGVLLPPLSEIVLEVGALATGVSATRTVSMGGLLIPTSGT